MTHTTCTHPDASATGAANCGEPQEWYCETLGGCGGYFVEPKAHDVQTFTIHADGCEYRRRGVPAAWCKCDTQRITGCTSCDKEFPNDTVTGPGVIVWN